MRLTIPLPFHRYTVAGHVHSESFSLEFTNAPRDLFCGSTYMRRMTLLTSLFFQAIEIICRHSSGNGNTHKAVLSVNHKGVPATQLNCVLATVLGCGPGWSVGPCPTPCCHHDLRERASSASRRASRGLTKCSYSSSSSRRLTCQGKSVVVVWYVPTLIS